MRITHNSLDLLKIEDRPLGRFLFFTALFSGALYIGYTSKDAGPFFFTFIIVVAVYLWLVFSTVRYMHATFDKKTAVLKYVERSISGTRKESYPLTSIIRADLDRKDGDDGFVYRAELMLQIRSGRYTLPLTFYHDHSKSHGQTVATINAWLDSARKRK